MLARQVSSMTNQELFPYFASVKFPSVLITKFALISKELASIWFNQPILHKFASICLFAFNSFQLRFKLISHLLQTHFIFVTNSLQISEASEQSNSTEVSFYLKSHVFSLQFYLKGDSDTGISRKSWEISNSFKFQKQQLAGVLQNIANL